MVDHHQPRVQIIVDQGFSYDTSNITRTFWNTVTDFLTPWPLKHGHTDVMVSGIKTLFFTFIATLLLITLYKLLKKLLDSISKLWVQSEPNEWLLVINNGNLVKSGIGLKTFVSPWDSVVTFPSKVQRLEFDANNVTSQMQGVNIHGVAFWSVHRQGDGPFKCYKYMEGGDANANVKTMCESILRNLIANSKLDDVLKKRDLMKQNMRKQLEKPLKGWGIWLEGVEITQVRISSKTLFEQLQAQFRNQTRIKAQRIQLDAKQKINQEMEKTDLKLLQVRQQTQTKKDQQSLNQQLERTRQKSRFDQENDKIQAQRLQRQKKLEIQRIKIQQQKQEQRIKNELKMQMDRDVFEEQKTKRRLQIDALYKDQALRKYSIDALERIYKNLGVKQMKINQFVTSGQQGNSTDLAKILPTIGLLSTVQNQSR